MSKSNKTSASKAGSISQDSPKDAKELQPDKGSLNLPDVKDIPGQEHVRPALPREMADTTAASDDEEGTEIFGDDDETGPLSGDDSDVLPDERKLLASTDDFRSDDDYASFRDAALDETDNDGTPLNEKGLRRAASGDDLDVPGSEDDDYDEEIGEEDEENNSYSLGGDDNEN